jgi:hypothetical protein
VAGSTSPYDGFVAKGLDMKETVKHIDLSAEFDTPEKCSIIELSNTADDPDASIARARVRAGVTTRWHRLAGIMSVTHPSRHWSWGGRGSSSKSGECPDVVLILHCVVSELPISVKRSAFPRNLHAAV